jgi:hypothetical protein
VEVEEVALASQQALFRHRHGGSGADLAIPTRLANGAA